MLKSSAALDKKLKSLIHNGGPGDPAQENEMKKTFKHLLQHAHVSEHDLRRQYRLDHESWKFHKEDKSWKYHPNDASWLVAPAQDQWGQPKSTHPPRYTLILRAAE